MVQEIITYLIIAGAFGVVIYNMLVFFRIIGGKKANASNCGSCSGGGCEIKDLHIMNKPKFSRQNKYQFYR